MSPGPQRLMQQDFSGGRVDAAPVELIPPSACREIVNGLLDDDGFVYRRGGVNFHSADGLPGVQGLTFVWDGDLVGGRRTVVATDAQLGAYATDTSLVVDAIDATRGVNPPTRPAVLSGAMYLPGGILYAGSRQGATYNAGTVTVTNGSKIVDGAGTGWNSTNVDAGKLLQLPGGICQVVASRTDATHLVLREPWGGATAAGQAYLLRAVGTGVVRPDGTPFPAGEIYAVAGHRLWRLKGSEVRFSERYFPELYPAGDPAQWLIPDGARIIGAEGTADQLVIFTTKGIWILNFATKDLTDADGNLQQSLTRGLPSLILINHAGIVTYADAIHAACYDGVWRIPRSDPTDGSVLSSSAEPTTRSIQRLWDSYIRAGYVPGVPAVHNKHLLLPMLRPVDGGSTYTPQDLLVCRLDSSYKGPDGRPWWPWVRLQGEGVRFRALGFTQDIAPSPNRGPRLLAATWRSQRVVDASLIFEPSVDRLWDVADGFDGYFAPYDFDLTTRDYPTGPPDVESSATDFRVMAGLTPAFLSSANVEVSVIRGPEGASPVVLGTVAVNDGETPARIRLAKRARHLRFRLFIDGDQPGMLLLKTIEMWSRVSGRMR